MPLFAAAALMPVALMLAAVWAGGVWVWAAFLYMAVLVIVLDQLIPYVAGNAPEGAEFPAADALLVVAGVSALGLMVMATLALTRAQLETGEKVLLFLAVGYWLGHVAHPTAHELIHRGNRGLYRLGVAVYAAMLFGHHASAHRLVHHRHVATPDDPSSAPEGESFWRFAPRAWAGGFRAGWAAESALRAKSGRGGVHPYVIYVACSGLALIVAFALSGVPGVLLWIGLSAHAQMQLLLADYVQHYGLRRAALPDGRYEPVTDRHSWNTPHWFSSALMFNAPRHSDHHAHPSRPYPALRLGDDAPMLPWPLPVACAMAMAPRLWRRMMRKPLARWQALAAVK